MDMEDYSSERDMIALFIWDSGEEELHNIIRCVITKFNVYIRLKRRFNPGEISTRWKLQTI